MTKNYEWRCLLCLYTEGRYGPFHVGSVPENCGCGCHETQEMTDSTVEDSQVKSLLEQTNPLEEPEIYDALFALYLIGLVKE